MNEETKKLSLSKHKLNCQDYLDLGLLFVLLFLSTIFTITGMEEKSAFDFGWNFYHGKMLWDKVMHPGILVLVLCVYVPLFITYIYRRHLHSTYRPSKKVNIIFSLLFLGLVLSNFLYPYGPQHFVFNYHNGDVTSLVDVDYAGYLLFDRFVNVVANFGFVSFFYLLFAYSRGYEKKGLEKGIQIALYLLIGFALFILVYSLFVEWEMWSNNILYFLGKSEEYRELHSLVGHKNMFAYYILLALFAELYLFWKKPHVIRIVAVGILLVALIIIPSRTSEMIAFLGMPASMVLYGIFHFKKHKGYAIFCFVMLGLIVLASVVILSLPRLRDSNLFEKLLYFKNWDMIQMRSVHWNMTLTMMNNPEVILLGYNKSPFVSIYINFENNAHFEVLPMAHNGFLEVFTQNGLLGLIPTVSVTGYLAYMDVSLIKRKQSNGVFLLLVLLLSILYAFLEPRYLFVADFPSSFFVLSLLIPTYYCYLASDDRGQTLVANLD